MLANRHSLILQRIYLLQVANFPFTTIEPNIGIAFVRVNCVCKEMGVLDNPVNSRCINGFRFIPIKLVDIAGLVPGAHSGRGLGNKFLDDARQADVTYPRCRYIWLY